MPLESIIESSKLLTGGENGQQALIYPQVKAAITASLGFFVCGSIGGWTGSALTKMDNDFVMGSTERSLVAGLINYGALLGSLFAGKAMDMLGRRKLMLIISPAAALGWLLIGISSDIYLVFLGRLISGFSAGFLLNASTIYTSETCQAGLRGRLGSLPTLNMTFGIFISYVLSGFFSWRMSAFLCIIPIAIFFFTLFLIPESPYWYLLKGNNEAASLNLRRLRGVKYDFEIELREMNRKIADVGAKVSYKELVKRRTLTPLLIALFIQTLQQVSGGNVIMTYTSAIFEKAHSSIDAQIATVYTGSAQLIGSIVSIFVIDKYGRKVLLITSVILCGIFTSIFGTYFLFLDTSNPWPTWLPLAILVHFSFSYCLGCRSIPWLIGSEIFNTSVRSRANSVLIFYNRLLCLCFIQTFPFAINGFGEAATFLAYGVLCFMCALGTLFFVPETKGRTLEEIQEYFESRASKTTKHDVSNKNLC